METVPASGDVLFYMINQHDIGVFLHQDNHAAMFLYTYESSTLYRLVAIDIP